MGKFYDEVKKAFPGLDENKHVQSTAGVSKKTMARQGDDDLMENGKPVTVKAALTEIGKSIDGIPEMIKHQYCPFKAQGGNLAIPFARFVIVISKSKPSFFPQLMMRVKAAAALDWGNVVDAICNEDIHTSPSYRTFLFANDKDMAKRQAIKDLAIEFRKEGTTEERKLEIGRIITELTWQNLIASPLAVVIEAGIGMEIDSEGRNSIAIGAGGSRAGAGNVAWEVISTDSDLQAIPLVQQVERCSKLLSQSVGTNTIGETVIGFAKKAESIDEEYFYPQIHVQLEESRKNAKETDGLIREIYTNRSSWNELKSKHGTDSPEERGEGVFFTPDSSERDSPALPDQSSHASSSASSSSSSSMMDSLRNKFKK